MFPIFFFFIMGIMYIFSMFSIHISVQKALTDTANNVSLYGYFKDEDMSKLLIQADFNQNLEKDYLGKPLLFLGSISLLKSHYNQEDIILTANYGVKIPLPLWNKKIIWMEQSAETRKFIGRYFLDEGEDGSEEEEYVFITENGSVYHRFENCTHLNLSIKEIEREELEDSRNLAGAKYKKCEICGKGKDLKDYITLYITLEGDRYHFSRLCSGLKRTVQRVPLKDVISWGECKRCGNVSVGR